MANRLRQRVMCCPCGRMRIVARGLCATCYTLKRKDTLYFGGLRESVLDRDGRRCRVCGRPGWKKRSLAVHHRVRGVSAMDTLITLCVEHHAMVTRTLVLNKCWPSLLIALWREQHPNAQEQLILDFNRRVAPKQQRLPFEKFKERESAMERPDRAKPGKQESGFPPFAPPLENARKLGVSHLPTTAAAAGFLSLPSNQNRKRETHVQPF